jgi:NitT/TauT family transport system substrate-binding protein
MKKTKLAALTIALAMGSTLFAACGSDSDSSSGADSSSGGTTDVKVGILGLAVDAPFFVADELGYFKDAGLNVTFTKFKSGADVIPATAANQVDVSWGSYTAGLFNALAQDIDVTMVASQGSVDANTTSGLVVSAKSGIDPAGGVEQLEGKTLAINGSGIGAQAYLHMMLSKAGVSDDSVKLKILDLPSQLSALASGSIDGAFLVDPLTSVAINSGFGKSFATNYAMADNQEHQIAAVLYSPKFAGNTDAGTRFMEAYLKASDLVYRAFNEDDAAAKADVAKAMMANLETVKSAKDLDSYSMTGGEGEIDTASIDMFLSAFKDLGLLSQDDVDYKSHIDESFAEAARKELDSDSSDTE